ncbi:MAG: sulfatase/phosphatase domain-containing protein [Candidatus Sumerlaeota bacterium]
MGFFEPHRPFDFGEAQPDDSKGIYIPDYIPQDPEYPEQIDAARKEFAALQGAVREADRAVGIVLDTLDEYGLRDDSIVIFTADHGIAMPMAKCTLYDAGIRTALIVDGPAWNAEGGKRLPGLVSNVDIFPTIADGLELTVADNVHGQSFLAYMQGGSEYRDAVFAEKTYHTIYDPMRCIRTKQYKYIINFESGASYDCPTDIRHNPIYSTSVGIFSRPRPPYELYDLKADPLEQNNLADDKEYTDLSRHLCEGIRSWMQETGDPLLQGPPRSPWYQQVIDSL